MLKPVFCLLVLISSSAFADDAAPTPAAPGTEYAIRWRVDDNTPLKDPAAVLDFLDMKDAESKTFTVEYFNFKHVDVPSTDSILRKRTKTAPEAGKPEWTFKLRSAASMPEGKCVLACPVKGCEEKKEDDVSFAKEADGSAKTGSPKHSYSCTSKEPLSAGLGEVPNCQMKMERYELKTKDGEPLPPMAGVRVEKWTRDNGAVILEVSRASGTAQDFATDIATKLIDKGILPTTDNKSCVSE